MYLPAHFEERRPEVLQQLIAEHPLGLLITLGAAGLSANPIPFVLDMEAAAAANLDPKGGHGVLRGHVARANPVWHEARAEVESLVVFQGPQAYISPSMYPTKAATGKVVPTWNYCVVQARGTLRAIEDPAWLHAFVTRLTDRHEAARPVPWAVSDAPEAYIASMLNAIVGIEIVLTALSGKWKMSQNRSSADRDGVVYGLRSRAQINADEQAAAVAALVAGAVKPAA